jgi:hypothetical protein
VPEHQSSITPEEHHENWKKIPNLPNTFGGVDANSNVAIRSNNYSISAYREMAKKR